MIEPRARFVIENGHITVGICLSNTPLIGNPKKVTAAGFFDSDTQPDTIIFIGDNLEYGSTSLYEIKNIVKEGKVFYGPVGRLHRVDKFKLKYREGDTITTLEKE